MGSKSLLLFFLLFALLSDAAAAVRGASEGWPATPFPPSPGFDSRRVLVLFDGPERDDNPGCIDARYTVNLLGHFTSRRRLKSLEDYAPGEWASYDAVFVIIYGKHYRVPAAFLADARKTDRTLCWMGNQAGQLDRVGVLRAHGLRFERFFLDSPYVRVIYKNQLLEKGDPDVNLFRVTDPAKAQVRAWAVSPKQGRTPYILQSENLWVLADSPFSYSSESDRYLAFADILHDVLGIRHEESHKALVRVEDLNALSDPDQLAAVLRVMEKAGVPFSFGVVPYYVNPGERLYIHLAEKPEVVDALKDFVKAGGVPVMHGYTHQHRGVTTDDYEFWDELGDRPVLGDSDSFVEKRLEEGIKELMGLGLAPVTWETPHYAGSRLDYKVIKKYFNTVYERRLVANRLGTDQYFPYPVIDLYGQYVLPESMAYIPKDNPVIAPLVQNARAELVVRDGYASFFIHPFLKPDLLATLLKAVKDLGFKFSDIREFPNFAKGDGRLISNVSGPAVLTGRGLYVNEQVLSRSGSVRAKKVSETAEEGPVTLGVDVREGETFLAQRQGTPPPTWFNKLIHGAKGDLSELEDRFGAVFTGGTLHSPLKVAFLWDRPRAPSRAASSEAAVDQESLYNTLTGMGYDVERLDRDSLAGEEHGTFSLMVVPWAAAKSLSEGEVKKILDAVSGGITLLTDGESPLSKALGIELGKSESVFKVADRLFPAADVRWPDRPQAPVIVRPAAEDVDVFYADADRDAPLMIGGEYGEGRYIFMSALFDPVTRDGTARFPGLPFILYDQFHISPIVKRVGVEAYFDPGYRQNISIEKLAAQWRRSGIRTVYAAAWHFYGKYTYDYERLIKVAHQNGILVYAWFEFPHVSQRFWDQHPEWRDKNGILTDAHVDWRFMMNLQEPDCQRAVLADMRAFLGGHPWDGANLAEFNFESPAGPARPDLFVPFNARARREFKEKAGFDPVDLFDPRSGRFWKTDPGGLRKFYEYRRSVNTRLLQNVLRVLGDVQAQKKGEFEIVLTVLDGLSHPELADSLALDMPRVLRIADKHGITVQAEDPAPDWSKSPDRYVSMGATYEALKLKKPFGIDINVLPVHPPNQIGFATSQQTGPELFRLWRAATTHAKRVCLYSESSVYPQDWELLPFAMASDATIKAQDDVWVVNSPNTVAMDLGRDVRKFTLDGQPWPGMYKGLAWIPPGEHSLRLTPAEHAWIDTTQLENRLIYISGELLGAQSISRGIEIEYSSPQKCAMVFNKSPLLMSVDGQWTLLPVLKADDGYVLFAPPGQHRLRLITGTAFRSVLEFTSVVSASLIVLFGMASTSLLVVLFLAISVRRRTRRFRRAIARWFSR